jgi:hypothetical protein
MGVVLALSLIIVLVVAVGVGGQRPDRKSKFTSKIASTARHLNGEGSPPAGLVNFFAELPISQSARSARSAASAKSADSASEKVGSR